jgi:hypothetical protein
MFNITLNKGFQITFENGWTASVQWGDGNYCSNRYLFGHNYKRLGEPVPPSTTAEVAAWDTKGRYYRGKDWSESIKGYCSPEEVAGFLYLVSNLGLEGPFEETVLDDLWGEDDED